MSGTYERSLPKEVSVRVSDDCKGYLEDELNDDEQTALYALVRRALKKEGDAQVTWGRPEP